MHISEHLNLLRRSVVSEPYILECQSLGVVVVGPGDLYYHCNVGQQICMQLWLECEAWSKHLKERKRKYYIYYNIFVLKTGDASCLSVLSMVCLLVFWPLLFDPSLDRVDWALWLGQCLGPWDPGRGTECWRNCWLQTLYSSRTLAISLFCKSQEMDLPKVLQSVYVVLIKLNLQD